MTRPTTDALLAAAATWLAAIAIVAAVAAADPVTAKATAPTASPSVALPAPGGRSAIGTFSLHWIDPSRADPFVLNKRRELMVQLWYPSRPATAAHAARYLPPRTARAFERVLGISTR